MLNTLNSIYLFGNLHYVLCFKIVNNDIIQLKILVSYITRKYFYHFLFKRYSVDGCQNRKKDTMNIKTQMMFLSLFIQIRTDTLTNLSEALIILIIIIYPVIFIIIIIIVFLNLFYHCNN